MKLVVDASVALKWLVVEEDSDVAGRLFSDSYEIHAPRLIVSEVANALWRKVTLQGLIGIDEAETRLESLSRMAIVWEADEIVCPDVLRIADALRHPAYDCVYLALARRIGATLVTADERFMNLVTPTEYRDAIALLRDL